MRDKALADHAHLVVERELFGQEPLNAYHSKATAKKIDSQMGCLSDVLLPLQDRA